MKDADLLWVAAHCKSIDAVVMRLDSRDGEQQRAAYAARTAVRAFGVKLMLETVVSAANADADLAHHVLTLGPGRWSIVRGASATVAQFVGFLENNYRAATELTAVDVEWNLTKEGEHITY